MGGWNTKVLKGDRNIRLCTPVIHFEVLRLREPCERRCRQSQQHFAKCNNLVFSWIHFGHSSSHLITGIVKDRKEGGNCLHTRCKKHLLRGENCEPHRYETCCMQLFHL